MPGSKGGNSPNKMGAAAAALNPWAVAPIGRKAIMHPTDNEADWCAVPGKTITQLNVFKIDGGYLVSDGRRSCFADNGETLRDTMIRMVTQATAGL